MMRDGASAFLTFYYIEKDGKRREKEEDNVYRTYLGLYSADTHKQVLRTCARTHTLLLFYLYDISLKQKGQIQTGF